MIIFSFIIILTSCSGENSKVKKTIMQYLENREIQYENYKIKSIEKINDTTFKCAYTCGYDDTQIKQTYKFYFSSDLSKITKGKVLYHAMKTGDEEWSEYKF
jgi:hypothetical protein